jgi:hypothetical protein
MIGLRHVEAFTELVKTHRQTASELLGRLCDCDSVGELVCCVIDPASESPETVKLVMDSADYLWQVRQDTK